MSTEAKASPLFTPPEAVDALVAKIHNITEPADRLDALAGMEAGARFIVAAELERLAERLKPAPTELVDFTSHGKQYHSGVEFVCGVLRRRASELRGEGKDGDG